MIVVLMGVSGAGKTTIGSLLAGRLGTVFADADDFHSAANKAKMAAGVPLDDLDRQPWLEALNLLMRGWAKSAGSGVLACSALKAAYRQTLQSGILKDQLHFVFLDAPRKLIADRLAARSHEYMNPGLLDSQLLALEPPAGALHVFNEGPPGEVVDYITKCLENTTP